MQKDLFTALVRRHSSITALQAPVARCMFLASHSFSRARSSSLAHACYFHSIVAARVFLFRYFEYD